MIVGERSRTQRPPRHECNCRTRDNHHFRAGYSPSGPPNCDPVGPAHPAWQVSLGWRGKVLHTRRDLRTISSRRGRLYLPATRGRRSGLYDDGSSRDQCHPHVQRSAKMVTGLCAGAWPARYGRLARGTALRISRRQEST